MTFEQWLKAYRESDVDHHDAVAMARAAWEASSEQAFSEGVHAGQESGSGFVGYPQ